MQQFSYTTAFTRNVGWVTDWEQEALRGKRVAIAGMGGVGGAHLLTLTRLGIGSFNIADFDTFDLVNFNRQVGATMASIGRNKLDVMAEMALDINPDLRIGRFPDGVQPDNLERFLDGVDLFVDGFDFFELAIRRSVFRRCAERGIPAITAAPIGMGTNWLVFTPQGMTFDAYFGFEGRPPNEQYLRFLMGLAPQGAHRKYLVDATRVDLERKIGPSTGASCQLCAGVVGVEAVKLLLGRGNTRAAPIHHHFDPYLGTFQRTRLRWGMGGPLQRVKLGVARRLYLRAAAPTRRPALPSPDSPMAQVIDLARWAPSGDNAQPWRFDIVRDDQIRVRFRSDATNPYEYRGGEPSLLSFGMLIETIRLAAGSQGRECNVGLLSGAGSDALTVEIGLPLGADVVADPLAAFITSRSVHRRPMRTRSLTTLEKSALELALLPELKIDWFETARERLRIARLGARVSDIRLRAPELFAVHQRVIDWHNRHSPDGLPAQALGLDRATLRVMRWAMQDWTRMERLNRFTGTHAATAQLDLWPGLRAAAFFAIAPAQPRAPRSLESTVRAGAAIQRFWLTATQLGLALQPAAALLMVAHHGESDTKLSADPALARKARAVSLKFAELFGAGPGNFYFLGRIGEPNACLPGARSVRRPWSELVETA